MTPDNYVMVHIDDLTPVVNALKEIREIGHSTSHTSSKDEYETAFLRIFQQIAQEALIQG